MTALSIDDALQVIIDAIGALGGVEEVPLRAAFGSPWHSGGSLVPRRTSRRTMEQRIRFARRTAERFEVIDTGDSAALSPLAGANAICLVGKSGARRAELLQIG